MTEQVLPRMGAGGRAGDVVQTMYTHMNKCKDDKMKKEK
jgi:hypothetical protein